LESEERKIDDLIHDSTHTDMSVLRDKIRRQQERISELQVVKKNSNY